MVGSSSSGSLALQSEFKVNEGSELRVVPRDVFGRVTTLLERAVEDGVFPGAVFIAGKNGEEVYRRAVGFRSGRQARDEVPLPMHSDMVFDIASLTQQVVTATLLMKLIAAGSVQLSDRVSRYLQCFSVHGKAGVTVEHLLSHSSGFPAWHPYFEELHKQNIGARVGILTSRGAREYVYNALNRFQMKVQPGSRELYSDLGFIVLGNLIEVLTGLPLRKAAQRFVLQPFGLKSTSFIDLTMMKRRGLQPVTDVIAPTEECSWRKRLLCGEVHDDNAWAMGGVAGHAGLFSSAPDLHTFAQEMLRGYFGHSGYADPAMVRAFWDYTPQIPGGSFVLGWQRADRNAELEDCGFSPKAVGHNSFTGCSMWIDPETASTIVLATNRIHPSRSNKKIREFRRELFLTVNQALV